MTIRMLSRMWNERGTFQRAVGFKMSSIKQHILLEHLEYIFIFTESPEQHIGHVGKVITLLKNADVARNLKKCRISTENIDYSGHVLLPRRLEMPFHIMYVICRLRAPTYHTEH